MNGISKFDAAVKRPYLIKLGIDSTRSSVVYKALMWVAYGSVWPSFNGSPSCPIDMTTAPSLANRDISDTVPCTATISVADCMSSISSSAENMPGSMHMMGMSSMSNCL